MNDVTFEDMEREQVLLAAVKWMALARAVHCFEFHEPVGELKDNKWTIEWKSSVVDGCSRVVFEPAEHNVNIVMFGAMQQPNMMLATIFAAFDDEDALCESVIKGDKQAFRVTGQGGKIEVW